MKNSLCSSPVNDNTREKVTDFKVSIELKGDLASEFVFFFYYEL